MVIDRPNALIVRLNKQEIGTLVRLPDRSITFTFSQSYLEDENRPTLSWGFYDSFKRLRARSYSSNPSARDSLPISSQKDTYASTRRTARDLPGMTTSVCCG